MTYKMRKRWSETNDRARSLRKGDNIAEALLWDELKGRRLGGYKFVRQFPLAPILLIFSAGKFSWWSRSMAINMPTTLTIQNAMSTCGRKVIPSFECGTQMY